MRTAICFLLLSLAVSAVSGQVTAPPRDAAASAPTGIVRGKVVNSATTNPLHRVKLTLNGDALNAPVPTGGKEIRGLEVVLTRKIGRVSGTVTDISGKPASEATVVVFSEDADHWVPHSRSVQATRPSSDGRFSVKGLPPGTYRAIVRDFIEQGQWEDRAFLDSIRDEGVRFVLREGATETLNLRLEGRR